MLRFETLALPGCGLLAAELPHHRGMTIEARSRFCVLVETRTAAIVTIHPAIVTDVADHVAVAPAASWPEREGTPLTAREMNVLLVRGLANKEIAARLEAAVFKDQCPNVMEAIPLPTRLPGPMSPPHALSRRSKPAA